MEGIVKWYDDAKGYGFIESDDGNDFYVHYSCINTDHYKGLETDWRVEFEIEEGPKGPQAGNVKVIQEK